MVDAIILEPIQLPQRADAFILERSFESRLNHFNIKKSARFAGTFSLRASRAARKFERA